MTSWSRRQILKTTAVAGGAAGLSWLGLKSFFASEPAHDIPVRILGPSAETGHRLRDGFRFPEASANRSTDVLIVGGGIAGLSAAWRLRKKGVENFQLLELENDVGGNSRFGQNAVSAYPWGAHYVTLLNDEAVFARELFEDLGVIKDYHEGRPVYNDYFLCQAPHERLFIFQKWQDGLLPKLGNSAEDDEQAKSFFAAIEKLRHAKGDDGRFAFAIPLEFSSRDRRFRDLDRLTMADYMRAHGWTSKPLNWYVNYCCRDDFGTPHTQTSAWAGLHYFCSRRGQADGVEGSSVLTWPEGNGWIVKQLRERLNGNITTHSMAFAISEEHHHVNVDCWNPVNQQVTRWSAKALILAVPRFIAAHLGKNLAESQRPIASATAYTPWMVANLTMLGEPPSRAGVPLAWDNVFYDSASLGYVVATHQRPAIHTEKSVWTYYRPLDQAEPALARKAALATSAEEWKSLILADLSLAHPEVARFVETIDVWIWGHAMIRPAPGFIWGEARAQMSQSTGRIHFAHSDMSGLSIFEEANFRGVTAADEVIGRGLV